MKVVKDVPNFNLTDRQLNFYIELERQESSIDRARELRDLLSAESKTLSSTTDDPSLDTFRKIFIKCKGLGIDSKVSTAPQMKELTTAMDTIFSKVYSFGDLSEEKKSTERQLIRMYLKVAIDWLEHVLFERPDLLK